MSDPYSAVVGGVSWTQVSVDVLLVFTAMASVLVILRGGRILLAAIRGDEHPDEWYDAPGQLDTYRQSAADELERGRQDYAAFVESWDLGAEDSGGAEVPSFSEWWDDVHPSGE